VNASRRGTATATLADAVSEARSGDIWLFRGRTVADRAIRLSTNAPVNHVALCLAIDDLPPLLWHAELGHSTPDVWTGTSHRGAQLHRLEDAARTWVLRYGQRAYARHMEPPATNEMEDAALAVVQDYSGRPFPRSRQLAKHWVLGRLHRRVSLQDLYCAELVAVTLQRMGLLGDERPPNWYDPGRFWSGDQLTLLNGVTLGPEVTVDVPPK
jgi:hypothetical protein